MVLGLQLQIVMDWSWDGVMVGWKLGLQLQHLDSDCVFP